jgi:hypothetical protein
MLKNITKIKKSIKKLHKKWLQLTWVNMSSLWPESWDEDNFIESKLK